MRFCEAGHRDGAQVPYDSSTSYGRQAAHARSFLANRQRAAEGARTMTSEVPLSIAPRDDQLWPTLTPSQIARVAKQGSLRSLQPGEVVLEAGQQGYPFFVVTNGELPGVRPSCGSEQLNP